MGFDGAISDKTTKTRRRITFPDVVRARMAADALESEGEAVTMYRDRLWVVEVKRKKKDSPDGE